MALEFTVEQIRWEWICHFEDVTWKRGMNDGDIVNDALQMRNGTGKTTALRLLQRLVINETLKYDDTVTDPDSPQGVVNDLLKATRYKGLAANNHIKRSEVGNSKFSVTLDVNGKKYTLIYVFSGDNGAAPMKAEIHTQTPSEMVHPKGDESGYSMPTSFTRAFEENFDLARLIFVDAQDMGGTANRLGKESMENLMRKMSNTNSLQYARQHRIGDLLAQRAKLADRTGSAREKESGEAALRSINATIRDLKTKESSARTERDALTKQIKEWEEKIEDLQDNSKDRLKFEQLKGDLKLAEATVKRKAEELRDALLLPSNLPASAWEPVKDYYQRLSSSRIPKTIAKEYLSAIMKEEVCICGREIHDDEMECIKQRMHDSMGLSILSEVYLMKDALSNSEVTADIVSMKESLEAATLKRDRLQSDVEGLNANLQSDDGDSVEGLSGKVAKAETRVDQLDDEIEMYSSKDDATITMNRKEWLGRSRKSVAPYEPAEGRGAVRDCKNLHYAEVIKKHLTKKVSKNAGISDLYSAGNLLSEVFEHVEVKVLEKLGRELMKRSNKHLDDFNMQVNFEIISLDNGVIVEHPDGSTQDRFSTGEEMSLVVCIVEAISGLTDVKIPLIIDNPTKGLGGDKGRALRLVYQQMGWQLMFLMYDTEKVVPGFEGYFQEGFVNPSTFKRELEIPGLDQKKVNQGHYLVDYDWDTWNSYDTSGEEDNHTKGA